MLSKNELRAEIKRRKATYSAKELRALSLPIIERLRKHPRLKAAKTVLLYHSMPDEVFTHDFVEEMVKEGKTVLLPVVVSKTEMEIRPYTERNEMRESNFHILEPQTKAFTDFTSIDFIAVPGVAFDTNGNRLGRGRGYYDRFLKAAKRAYKLGVCFDFQKVECVPTDALDCKIDAVI